MRVFFLQILKLKPIPPFQLNPCKHCKIHTDSCVIQPPALSAMKIRTTEMLAFMAKPRKESPNLSRASVVTLSD